MRFRMVSLLAGTALLALSAGGVLAIADTEDQHQDVADAAAWDAGDFGGAQTFTAGISGGIDRVSLWGMTTGWSIAVEIHDGDPTGTLLGTSSTNIPPTSGTWLDVAFSPAVQVTALSSYAIVLKPSGAVRIGGTCGANAYSGGQALVYKNNTWQAIASTPSFESCITDFAFRTFVTPMQTTNLQWDKTQITAGKTTPLTLTETFTFAEIVRVDVVAPAGSFVTWSVKQVALPAWFTVAGITCSSQIANADCVLANAVPGSTIPVTPDGLPIIIRLTGTASPDASAGGTTGTANGEGCVTPVGSDPVAVCVADQASVAVGAFDVTAAPTTTGSGGSSRDSMPQLAILACLALGGLGIAAVEAQRRSIRS